MKAVMFGRFGEPAEVLTLQDMPTPTPGPGEVRVRMLASPVNPSDLMMIRGVYGKLPTLPATPGFEGVGVVTAAGGGLLGKFMLGKRVAVLNGVSGNWQEETVVPARQVVPLSRKLTVEQSAMFFVNPATAYVMTRCVLQVPRGEWLLQTAAGSALGRMVIRLGKHYGFKTLNLVRRPEQARELSKMGADAVFACSPDDVRNQVRGLVPQGVKYALDPVGGAVGSQVIQCLAPGGKLLVFGTLSSEPLSFSPRDLMTPGTSVQGFWLANYMQRLGLPGKLRLVWKVGKLIEAGVLTADVSGRFSLAEVADAVRAADTPGKSGKIILEIADE